jgi:hypothetical protein
MHEGFTRISAGEHLSGAFLVQVGLKERNVSLKLFLILV